jgi:hypothetical protein
MYFALKLSKFIDIDYYTMKYELFNCKARKSPAEIITQYPAIIVQNRGGESGHRRIIIFHMQKRPVNA